MFCDRKFHYQVESNPLNQLDDGQQHRLFLFRNPWRKRGGGLLFFRLRVRILPEAFPVERVQLPAPNHVSLTAHKTKSPALSFGLGFSHFSSRCRSVTLLVILISPNINYFCDIVKNFSFLSTFPVQVRVFRGFNEQVTTKQVRFGGED